MSLFRANDREGVEKIVAEQRQSSTNFNWAITQGMHITRTETPFDCLVELSKHDLQGVLGNITQDVLVTDEQAHLFDTDWVYRIMRELTCARSVTARIFTAREGAEQHCQVGNSALARDEMIRWLAKFHQAWTNACWQEFQSDLVTADGSGSGGGDRRRGLSSHSRTRRACSCGRHSSDGPATITQAPTSRACSEARRLWCLVS